MKALGVALSSRDSAALFEALDADGSGSLAPLELEVLLLGRPSTTTGAPLSSPTRTATPAAPTEAPAAADTTAAATRWAVCSRLLPIYILGRLRPASDASGPSRRENVSKISV